MLMPCSAGEAPSHQSYLNTSAACGLEEGLAVKAFKVDMDRVDEIDMPEDFVTAETAEWNRDCVRLDNGHGAWLRDEALFQRHLAVATFGDPPNVPLPAYVTGAAGEKTVAAMMSLEEVEALVTGRMRVF